MLTDSELDQACDIIVEHEGLVTWLYCDDLGYVTTGAGDKVGATSVLTMPFYHESNNKHASAEEKQAAYYRVQDFYHKGFTASAYIALSDLRLPEDYCRRRVDYRIKNEFVPGIVKHCPQFARFPTDAKLVLVDIAYNVGCAGFAEFQFLIDCCNEGQFDLAGIHVHTKKEGEDPRRPETWGRRNRWRLQTMARAAQAA